MPIGNYQGMARIIRIPVKDNGISPVSIYNQVFFIPATFQSIAEYAPLFLFLHYVAGSPGGPQELLTHGAIIYKGAADIKWFLEQKKTPVLSRKKEPVIFAEKLLGEFPYFPFLSCLGFFFSFLGEP